MQLKQRKNETQTGQIQILSFKTHPSFVCFLSHFPSVSFLTELIKLLYLEERCSLSVLAISQTIKMVLCEEEKNDEGDNDNTVRF